MFHNKKFKLISFLQKGKLSPEKQVIFSVLVFLPTQSILNYSVFCMLIFCMNQCRCSLSAERSRYIELLSVIICATKIRNLKPDLRKKKLVCMFSIWHLIKLWQILHCQSHFQSVCQNKCWDQFTVCHVQLYRKLFQILTIYTLSVLFG